MTDSQFDRSRLNIRPLSERRHRLSVGEDMVSLDDFDGELSAGASESVEETAERIRSARSSGRPVVLAFGAHAIKNGLGPVLIHLMREGWVQHLATNGAGIIHDWEFAFLGETSEDVEANTADGQFGIWEETGFHLNLALVLGAYDGLGYGESVGRLIQNQQHNIPSQEELCSVIERASESAAAAERGAAAADLLSIVKRFELEPGILSVPHQHRQYSAQAAAFKLGIPFTAHPMIGHDIIYTHPLNHCAAIGRAAQRDFLMFANQISRIDGGVYLSVGSAVMSPMIFEKSFSMSQNLAIQKGRHIDDHFIVVVDLAESRWDWSKGEPPPGSPEYYLRYCKTFSRMGGALRYVTADNRDFLPALCGELGAGRQC